MLVQPLHSESRAIVIVPAPGRPAERPGMALAVRTFGLLPALVATPRRALFAAGLAFGLVSPHLLRFVAGRALSGALRALGGPAASRTTETDEVIVEHLFASRIVVRKVKG